MGADPQTDVAVLKIEAKNLPVVKTGDVNQLQVGEWVLAIGSPYGLENTATAGIVSAKGRSLPDDTSVPFIQTDVAVNPGNSGGPLFNDRGEVVGINSQIYSRTGGFQGLSFSIPIDVAYKIKDQILEHGKVQHARLGVTVQEVNQDLANSFKLETPTGALVASVERQRAERAGLQPGDVVRQINGKTIVSSGDLASMITLASPGDKLKLDVWRNGSPKELSATLGGVPKDKATASSDTRDVQRGQLGLALRPLSPQEQRQSGAEGLLIEQSAGPAAKAGIQPGDVLLSLNGVPVRDIGRSRRNSPRPVRRAAGAARRRQDLRAGADRLIRALTPRRAACPARRHRGRQLAAGRVDAHDRGHGGQVALQATRVGHLRHQADIGDGGRVAVAIAAGGGRGRQLRLEGLQPLVHPMAVPGVLGVFVHARVCFRYFSTRRLFSGCVSQAMPSARSRTRARPMASAGSSGVCGWVSSRYSMMASDWPMTASPSISVGTSAVGLSLR